MASQVHKLRDGFVVASLLPLFHQAGFEDGGFILNYDPEVRKEMTPKTIESRCHLEAGDLIFLPPGPRLMTSVKRRPRICWLAGSFDGAEMISRATC